MNWFGTLILPLDEILRDGESLLENQTFGNINNFIAFENMVIFIK